MMALVADGRVERTRIFTPFGIRFWDPAMNAQVKHDLTVNAYPEHKPYQLTSAVRTVSGIYAFHGLPGMRALEYPTVPGNSASPSPSSRFIVQVFDKQGCFLPVSFSADLPVHGIFPTDALNGSSSVKPPGFYLFSAPTRAAKANLALVRADLEERIDAGRKAPAAFAVLEVRGPGNLLQYGLADERGCVALLFPYPPFAVAMGSSPPPIDIRQRWGLNVTVRYQPSVLSFSEESRLPDLRSVFNQGPGMIWSSDPLSPDQPVGQITAELVYREELVLRSGSRSSLQIRPALTSP
jgi:hypothetical protein